MIYNLKIEKEARHLAKEKVIERGQTSNPHEDPDVESASSSDAELNSSPDPRQEIPKTPPLQQYPPIIEPIAMADGGQAPETTLRKMMETDVTKTPTGINYPVLEGDSELKSSLVHRLQTFHGLEHEDPHKHLKMFHIIFALV